MKFLNKPPNGNVERTDPKDSNAFTSSYLAIATLEVVVQPDTTTAASKVRMVEELFTRIENLHSN